MCSVLFLLFHCVLAKVKKKNNFRKRKNKLKYCNVFFVKLFVPKG